MNIRKTIFLLILSLVLLVGIYFLARLIGRSVDKEAFSDTKPNANATTTLPTRPSSLSTDLTQVQDPTSPSTDTNQVQDPSSPSTDPNEVQDPTTPSTGLIQVQDPTDPSTDPTQVQDPTSPSTNPNDPTAPSTGPATPPSEPPKGQPAPFLQVYDGQGNPLTLDAFSDKPIVLCFWASWNTNSRAALGALETFYHKNKDQAHFLVVNVTDGEKETQQTAEEFLATKQYPFYSYFDLDDYASTRYSVENVPLVFFIRADHQVIAYATAPVTAGKLAEGLGLVS